VETPDGARFCPDCGFALAGGAPPPGLRKVVTILFCDLCGSTELGERLDPETLRHVVAQYFASMSAVLERHDAVIEKFIGDAVMAVFGVPAVREDDALRAVRAAVGMRVALAELNEQLGRRHGVTLQTRMGVNTGEVIVGDPSRGQGFVSGDAVNVAARLEQAAPPGGILIGEHTHQLVRRAVEVEPVAPLALKGKSEPVRAFGLLHVDIDDGVGLADQGLCSPLVGREPELERLRAAFARALEQRSCELVTIVGPAGIGKSRLTQDFTESVAQRAAVAVGRCVSYGEGLTFWPLREVVTALLAGRDGTSPHDVQAGLARLVEGDDDAAAIVDYVAGALGWSEPAADPAGIFWAVRRLLRAAAAERPLIVVFEDMHWAEPILLDLLEHLADALEGVPVLIVALARRELLDIRPRFGGDAPRLELQPLGGDDSRRLVEHLLGDDGVDAELAERVFARAEGNPLFVEELVRMLVDERRLERGDAGLSVVRSSVLSLPPTIHALLAARIDRLEPAERDVVQAGAVIGRSFGAGALLALVDGTERATLETRLEALVRKQVIEPDGGRFAGDPTLSITHVLLRDVAYQGLLKARRAELHVRHADWLERAAGERAGEYDEILGYHLERAHHYLSQLGALDERGRDLGARAAGRLGSSGSRALARGDTRAAVSLLERAVALLDADGPARRELTTKLGIALAEAGQLTRVDALLRDRLETGRRGSAFVVLHDPSGRQHVVALDRTTRIGRLPDNEVALTWDDGVSRRHAQITRLAEGWALLDNGSRNGSYVNGERMTEQRPLHDGDILRFGDSVVLFTVSASVPADAALSPRSDALTHVPGPAGRGGGASENDLPTIHRRSR
jgi:class 3 adenylate cyclase